MPRSDRPFFRKVIRLGALALGRAHAHRQDVWPGLRIDTQTGRVTWRGRDLLTLKKAAEIIPQGVKTIAVVGSGPSLKGQNIQALGDDTAILCNGAASLARQLRPLAIAIEDERFIFRHHAMVTSLRRDLPLLLSPAAMRAWAERDAASLQGRDVALIDNLTKPVNLPRRGLSDPALNPVVIRKAGAALSIDPDTGVVITGTVAFSALQFAMTASPEQIILAGIDLTNDNQPRFYEGADRAPSGLSAGLGRIMAGFGLAKDLADKRGITLLCASPVSALLGLGIPYDNGLDG